MWRRGLIIFGWALILLSPLPWLAVLTAPLWGLDSVAEAIAWGFGLLLLAEVLFFAGAAIVGPSVYHHRHAIWAKLTGRTRPPSSPPPQRGPDERA
jgi:hypothetical protein